MNYDYNDIDVAQLISCVQRRPLLYDKSQSDYSNVVLRDQTWVEIAKEVSSTDLECKRKWNYLRGKFAREVKCDPNNRESPHEVEPIVETSNWPFLKNMMFLKGHCRKRIKNKFTPDTGTEKINTLEEPSLQQLAEIAFNFDGNLVQQTEQQETNDTDLKKDVKSIDFFTQQNLEYSSPSSSGLPMFTSTTSTNTDNETSQEQLFETEIPNKKIKFSTEMQEVIEGTVLSMISTVKDIVERQPGGIQIQDSSATNSMLDHFAQFISCSLRDVSSKKRNDAMSHITTYLLNLRNEENL